MGYTSYTEHKQYNNAFMAKMAFESLRAFAKVLFEEAAAQGIKLGNGHGEEGSTPDILPNGIYFNGVGADSYETCCAELVKMVTLGREDFTFCKTARKPYDPVVLAFYMQGVTLGVFNKWSSDGSNEPKMMNAGKALLKAALKRQKAQAKAARAQAGEAARVKKAAAAKRAVVAKARQDVVSAGKPKTGAAALAELKKLKSEDLWAEHRTHARQDWIEQVRGGNTQLGYWDWVAAQLFEAAEEAEQERRDSKDATEAEVK